MVAAVSSLSERLGDDFLIIETQISHIKVLGFSFV